MEIYLFTFAKNYGYILVYFCKKLWIYTCLPLQKIMDIYLFTFVKNYGYILVYFCKKL